MASAGTGLFDHHVSLSDKRGRYLQSDRVRHFQVNREDKFRRLGERDVCHLYAPKKLVHHICQRFGEVSEVGRIEPKKSDPACVIFD
jgi:hypothetical protein